MDGYILNGPLQMADWRKKGYFTSMYDNGDRIYDLDDDDYLDNEDLYMISLHRSSDYYMRLSFQEARDVHRSYSSKYTLVNTCDDPEEYFRSVVSFPVPLCTVSERLRDDEDFLIRVFTLTQYWVDYRSALDGPFRITNSFRPISARLQDDEYFFARLLKLIRGVHEYEVDSADVLYRNNFAILYEDEDDEYAEFDQSDDRVNVGSYRLLFLAYDLNMSDRIREELAKDPNYLDQFMPGNVKPAKK